MAHASILGYCPGSFSQLASNQQRCCPRSLNVLQSSFAADGIKQNACKLHTADTAAAAAAAAAAGTAAAIHRRSTCFRTRVAAQDQQQYVDDNDDPQQLLAILASTKNYTHLAALVKSRQDAFLHSPLCVYALLHAVQLRETISDEQVGKGSLASEDKVLQHMDMVEQLLEDLCDAAEQQLDQLPLPTQATLPLALAQLNYQHQPLYEAIAAAVQEQLAEKLPIEEQQQQQQQGGTTPAAVAAVPPGKAAVLCELPESLVPGVLLSLTVAYSLNGHHDESLMNELAGQAVAFKDYFPDATPLISMSAALLDLQHYCPDLVATAAAAALQQLQQQEFAGEDDTESSTNSGGGLGPDEVVSLLLALGFFRVEASDFVEAALEAFAADVEVLAELEPVQLSRLWKAVLLLRQQGINTPAELIEVFSYVQSEDPDLLLLGACRAAVDAAQLQYVQDANDVMLQQWEQAGLLAPAQILSALQDMGYQLERGVQVSAAAGSVAQQQRQQQQGEQQQQGDDDVALQAAVDVCLRLPDGRLVAVLPLDEGRYCHSPPKRLRGAAAVDILVLKALGLAVLPLPIVEWQALAGDEGRQRRYLEARIAAATS